MYLLALINGKGEGLTSGTADEDTSDFLVNNHLSLGFDEVEVDREVVVHGSLDGAAETLEGEGAGVLGVFSTIL